MCHRIVHFKVVNFIFYKFHFNKLGEKKKGGQGQLHGESLVCAKI